MDIQKLQKYWHDRAIEEEKKVYEVTKKQIELQEELYTNAKRKIDATINYYTNKFMKNNKVDYIKAKELLTKDELKEFRWTLSNYINNAKKKDLPLQEFEKIQKQLTNSSLKHRIDKLEAMKHEINMQLNELAKTKELMVEEHLSKVYEEQYYRNLYNNAIATHQSKYISRLNPSQIQNVVRSNWLSDGSSFSDIIWKNKEKLLNEMQKTITVGIISGKTPYSLSEDFARVMNVDKSRARVLLQTESARVRSMAEIESYKQMGVSKYQIIATLDDRTSDICQSMDMKVFDTKDYEVGVTAPPFHPNCFDKETEIFTNNGWKYFKDLKENDEVYTLNKETLIPEWQKPINYISYYTEDKLLHFKNARMDLMVTKNHNILVQNMDNSIKDKSFKLRPAEQVGRKSKNRMYSGVKWIGENKEFEYLANKKIDIDTYLKFMAYWLADGSCTADRGSYNIKIAQTNNDWMYNELKKLPFKIYKCKDSLMIHNKELGEYLKQFGKCTNKFIPENIKLLSPNLLDIFLLAYAKTDGHITKGKRWKDYQFKDSISFFTTSNQMSADLGELIMKVGATPSYYLNKSKGKQVQFKNGIYTINNDCWVINYNKQVYNWTCYMDIQEVEYNDYVYCVEVEKHNTLLVRRNGKVCWSGNCRSTKAPYYEDNLITQGGRIARDPETGKQYTVGNISYSEWVEKYVKNPEQLQGYGQYARYKKVLGDKVPNSFENFVDIKYNNGKEYKALKTRYKATKSYTFYKKYLNKRMPKTIDDLMSIMKNSNQYDTFKREYETIKTIKRKDWSKKYKKKVIKCYDEFKKEGIELTWHGASSATNRIGLKEITKKEIIETYNKPINYIEYDKKTNTNKNVRYYDLVRVITNEENTEVLTVVKDDKDRSQGMIRRGRWKKK